MTRKEFIKNFTALGLASPFISTLLTSCSKKEGFFSDFEVNFDGKVLVIGAGAAGVTAGYILKKQGIDFQILEAAPIHGGRVKKAADFADFPIDLGGEWIHTDPSILAKLNNDRQSEVDIDIITYNPQTISVWKNGELKRRNFASNFYSEYKFKNSSWFDFFDQLMVPHIQDHIVYNCPVKEIDYSGEKVMVTSLNDDIYEADKILVTVPLKILQNDFITFIPALPEDKQDALTQVEMPDGLKVFIEFSEKFYPDVVMFDDLIQAAINSDHTYYNAAFGKDSDRHVFALFTVGEPASAYTSLQTEEAIFNKVMGELDDIFDGKASQYYIQHIIQNWSQEPYIQGSYSHYDNYGALDTLARPIDDKVFFAGEAYTSESQATVHGAAETAYSSVEKMLSLS
ncbi:MAG: FAD-dependent oxidoreductase [Chitinophagales bacterium]|nr:FAD-dependent oxidoreductase [Chitinophagales bacterium]